MKNKQQLVKFISSSLILTLCGLLPCTLSAQPSSQGGGDTSKHIRDADGSWIEIKADGSKIIKKPDGSSVQMMPNGAKLIENADGSTIQIRADGSKTIKNSDGTKIEVKPGA